MRQLLTVCKFEFLGFLKEKVYIFSTLCLCLVIGVVLFFPRLMSTREEGVEHTPSVVESEHLYALYDPMDILKAESFLQVFPKSTLVRVNSLEELKQNVEKLEVRAGFYVKNDLQYEYYVYNSSIKDVNQKYFENLMIMQYRNKELASLGTDVEKVNQILSITPNGSMVALGKDGLSGYHITFAMIMLIYMLILLYGSLISTRVASEKGSRAMEILVTSASPNALIFGKVLASALAGLLQIGIVLATAYICYGVNIAYWSTLGIHVSQIPLSVVFAFIGFGLFGYLLYSFMFGALGALVDKVEDVNTSMTPIILIFVVSFIITTSNLSNIDGIIIKIASFVPFSSCLAMLARIVIGNVMSWEILLSFIILVLSTLGIGFIGAKIYRRGTLMYGNKGKVWSI